MNTSFYNPPGIYSAGGSGIAVTGTTYLDQLILAAEAPVSSYYNRLTDLEALVLALTDHVTLLESGILPIIIPPPTGAFTMSLNLGDGRNAIYLPMLLGI